MPKIEEDGKRWLRRPKLYKGVVEPYKKKKEVAESFHANGRTDRHDEANSSFSNFTKAAKRRLKSPQNTTRNPRSGLNLDPFPLFNL